MHITRVHAKSDKIRTMTNSVIKSKTNNKTYMGNKQANVHKHTKIRKKRKTYKLLKPV